RIGRWGRGCILPISSCPSCARQACSPCRRRLKRAGSRKRWECILSLRSARPFSEHLLPDCVLSHGRRILALMSEITPETLLTAGGLVLMTIAVWWGGKAVKGWFWACYAGLMVLALAYALWRWLR